MTDEATVPQTGPVKMAEFNVNLGSGRAAIVLLPVGVNPVEMLALIGALPAIGLQANKMGETSALDRILVPHR